MMKLIFVFAAFIVVASAAKVKKPIEEYFTDFAGEEDIHLITGEDDRPPTNFVGDVMKAKTTSIKTKQGTGKFNYNFETQNGINIASIGKLKDSKTFVVSGSYSYTGADGKRYRVRYTADEFGYHPVTTLDDEPEPVITPAPTPAPLPRPTFAPLPAFQNANRFGNAHNQNSVNDFDGYAISKQHNNGYGLNYDNRFNSFGSSYNQNGNGYNAVNGYNAFDRAPKSFGNNGLVFNQNFVRAQVPNELSSPNRLYLPAAPTYLPPVAPYQPIAPYQPAPQYQQYY